MNSISRLILTSAIIHCFATATQAQSERILNLDDLVSSGFSGTHVPGSDVPVSEGAAEIDQRFIAPDKPSARVFDVTRPGNLWDGWNWLLPAKFQLLAKDTGQVFGIAIDDQEPANIYLEPNSFRLNRNRVSNSVCV